MYSMDDLSRLLNVSKQSLYKLIKNNQELSTLINEHSTTVKRKIFYDDEVLSWFKRYYRQGVSSGVGADVSQDETSKITEDTALQGRIEKLEAQVEALKAQIEETEARLKACEKEKQRLFEENGALLLTVSQMSSTISQMSNTAFQQFQASIKMLPAPRQPFLKRLKAIFAGKSKEDTQNAPEPPQNAE